MTNSLRIKISLERQHFERVKMCTAEAIIQKLGLTPLDGEGGYFRRTYESEDQVATTQYNNKPCGSAILYLITATNFSAIHRLMSADEIFHFYAGSPCEMLQIDPEGNLNIMLFGNNILENCQPQIIVKRKVWQGLRVLQKGQWALMGTTVTPGFEYEDFELGTRAKLLERFPQHQRDIIHFTRDL